ncbi:hypothetical protein BB560_004200 [Smittium megazygosporum]|uniref:Translation initiation factor eIF2B subunit alpha n=1 Tax=Smittium megazygosporum TaxID=133381 RepID=A0A2T9Z9U3_9FUNG|nr:hypothetical protein BB560_004200 [Smittium megazygosporum]
MSEAEEFDVVQCYNSLTISPPIAAVSTLVEMLCFRINKLKLQIFCVLVATTISEFVLKVQEASNRLTNDLEYSISLRAGCAVFVQLMTKLTMTKIMNLEECRKSLIESGISMVENANQCRETISSLSSSVIRDNMVILLHSYSRVIMGALKYAAKQNKRFSVYVTESHPIYTGQKTAKELKELGIPCKVILDSSVGYYIAKVDVVLLGAEGVVENGGLNNDPLVDYTPPEYINFLFTDLGIFTPAAVSDELIKFYLD